MDKSNPSTTGQPPSDKEPKNQQRDEEWLVKRRGEIKANKLRIFIDLVGGAHAYEDFTFEKFLTKWDQPEALKAAQAFDPDRDNLYFWGPSRVGKTHLATAIAHKYFDLGCSINIVSIPDFKDKLRKLESRFEYGDKIELISTFSHVQILIFHELGRGKAAEMIRDTIWSILEKRITAGRNGLIVTSQYSIHEIGKMYGATISARLEELCGPKGIVRFKERGE